MRFANDALISAADASADQTSAAFDASYVLSGSVQVVATGATAAGTLKVQASNDMPMPGHAPTHWFDVTGLPSLLPPPERWRFQNSMFVTSGFGWCSRNRAD